MAALARNWQALDKVSQGALTGAVVKADAYGMGIDVACTRLHAAGARFFFAATPDEAVAVRSALPDAHVFVLNGLFPGAAPLYVGERLMPILSSIPMLEEWLQACLARNEALPAALHFDTGINRLGFRLNEASIVRAHDRPARLCAADDHEPPRLRRPAAATKRTARSWRCSLRCWRSSPAFPPRLPIRPG